MKAAVRNVFHNAGRCLAQDESGSVSPTSSAPNIPQSQGIASNSIETVYDRRFRGARCGSEKPARERIACVKAGGDGCTALIPQHNLITHGVWQSWL